LDSLFQPTMPVEGREGKEVKCKICNRKADENGYCKSHAKAYGNIIQRYDLWRTVLKISWKEYLSEIANNPLTGQWAKEVAQHLMNCGEKENVAKS
jgi:hypothetical protein